MLEVQPAHIYCAGRKEGRVINLPSLPGTVWALRLKGPCFWNTDNPRQTKIAGHPKEKTKAEKESASRVCPASLRIFTRGPIQTTSAHWLEFTHMVPICKEGGEMHMAT